MPTASIDDVLAGSRLLPSGERAKIFRPYIHRWDWDGSRVVRVALTTLPLADLLAPTSGPSASDTREAPEMAVAVADPAARPSAPRPSPATPYADLCGWAVAA